MSTTNKYELLIIFSLKDSKEVSSLKKEVTEILENTNFEIYKDNELGKRVLAYPIRKETEGFYWVPIITAKDNASINQLFVFLKRKPYILRTMILKYDEEKLKRLKEKEEKYKKAKLEAYNRKRERQNAHYNNQSQQQEVSEKRNSETEN